MVAGHRAHIIVLGNEKGGSGKSTTAMHLAIGLLRQGFGVATVDLDTAQQTLTRYLDNRRVQARGTTDALAMPEHHAPETGHLADPCARGTEARGRLADRVADLAGRFDFLVVDLPAGDGLLSRLGHTFADSLVTPINDSFLDLDLLASVRPGTLEPVAPSRYSRLVAEQRGQRRQRDRAGIDWVVVRNRLGTLESRNNRRIGEVLQDLAPRLGFRVAPGLVERVIYRELFLSGHTVLDPTGGRPSDRPNPSHAAARQEVLDLLRALWLPQIDRRTSAVATG